MIDSRSGNTNSVFYIPYFGVNLVKEGLVYAILHCAINLTAKQKAEWVLFVSRISVFIISRLLCGNGMEMLSQISLKRFQDKACSTSQNHFLKSFFPKHKTVRAHPTMAMITATRSFRNVKQEAVQRYCGCDALPLINVWRKWPLWRMKLVTPSLAPPNYEHTPTSLPCKTIEVRLPLTGRHSIICKTHNQKREIIEKSDPPVLPASSPLFPPDLSETLVPEIFIGSKSQKIPNHTNI